MSLCPIYYGRDYQVALFLQDVSEGMIYLVPAAIVLVLWKVFVTMPRARVVVLGLDESSACYSRLSGRVISGWVLLLYGIISVLTFSLGVFAFDLYRYCMGIISSLVVWKFPC